MAGEVRTKQCFFTRKKPGGLPAEGEGKTQSVGKAPQAHGRGRNARGVRFGSNFKKE